jgi:hypothetical protein
VGPTVQRLCALLLLLAACRPATSGGGSGALDDDGVQMLLPSAWGSSFRLGDQDPNSTPGFEIEKRGVAVVQYDGRIRYWKLETYDLDYSSGGNGKTSRLHIHPNSSPQSFNWRTQQGHLGSTSDFKNQEFTAYVRVRGIFDLRRAAISLKIRGGRHTQDDGDLASCTMMTFAPHGAPAVSRFGKELHHPDYDYVVLEPRFQTALQENRWVGLKLVSYADPLDGERVVNQLFVDDAPFDERGRPSNGFRLLSEYVDVEGRSTGKYDKLVDWGGLQNTVRVDGVSELDFAIVSVREIDPG